MKASDDGFVPRLPGASREAALHEQLYRYAEDLGQVIEQLDQLHRENQELANSHSLTQEQLGVLEDLLQGSHQMHLVTDPGGRILRANAAAASIGSDLSGRSLRDLVVESDRQRFDAQLQRAIDSEAHIDQEFLFDDRNGKSLILSLRPAIERAHGKITCIHWLARDVTQTRESEFDSQLATMVLNNATEAVMITDAQGVILSVNPAFSEITGYEAAEVVGQTPWLLAYESVDPAFYKAFRSTCGELGRWQGEQVNRRKNGELFTIRLTVTSVRDKAGSVLSYVAVFTDLSRVREAENRLARLAHFDSLTELPNRLLLNDRISQACSSARRFSTEFAFLYIDLDGFKQINDRYGHAAGDHILKETARRIAASCREADTAARIGGDEFAVLLPGINDPAEIERFCRRLIDAVTVPIAWGEFALRIGASLGCARYPVDADDHEVLMRRADAAMYQAKQAGGNLLAFWIDSADGDAADEPRIDLAIAQAAERGELQLFYQPQVTGSGAPRTFGVEALLRWKSPQFGEQPPDVFIPIAEKTGAIVSIGRWVLKTACAQLRAWWDIGLEPLSLSVNVSPRQLRDPDFVASVTGILKASGIPPAALELEISESEAMLHADAPDSGSRPGQVLTRLHELGVRIAIDDFGTGFSNVGRLRTLPIDRIKIDRSFVGRLETCADAQALTTCIIAMGRALGLAVTAEGVETEAQREALTRQGCGQHQGFAYARPMSAEAFVDWLEGNRRNCTNQAATFGNEA